jgi:hypothetical protein
MFHTTRLGFVVMIALGLSSNMWAASPAGNTKAKAAMDQTLPLVDFRNVTLGDAVAFLRDVSGETIHVNWKGLDAAGVTRDTVINLKLQKVTLRQALKLVLSEAAGTTDLTFYREEGLIEVTTRELADSQMIVVVYPVQDLLAEPLEAVAFPEFTSNTDSSNAGGNYNNSSRNNRGNSGTSRYTSQRGNDRGTTLNSFAPNANTNQMGRNPDQAPKSEQLLDLIVATVSPDVWTQNGGKASIRLFDGNLVVSAPRSVHEALGGPVD